MAANGISTLALKRDRQEAKLALAAINRAASGRNSEYDLSQLPTLYHPTDNAGALVDNPNSAGLLEGRPWSTSGITFSSLAVDYDPVYAVSGTNIVDQSGNDRTGVLVGAAHDATNDYFVFDGVNDYIRTPDLYSTAVANPDTFSVAAWVYPTAGGVVVSVTDTTTPSTAYHYSAIELIDSGGSPVPYFGIWNGGIQPANGSALSYNQWYHLALTYNGTVAKGYVNGVEVTSVTAAYDSPLDSISTSHYFLFGAADTTNMGDGSYFNGRMGEMRIYNDGLTEPEVLANYNASKGRYGY